jgi:hypothetical protein
MSYSERFPRESYFTVHHTVHCTLYRRATRHVLTRAAKCTDVDCRIFENVNCTNFVTWIINTGIRNSALYLFLINSFETVPWHSSVSETVRNRTHVHKHTSQNIDFPPGTPYIVSTQRRRISHRKRKMISVVKVESNVGPTLEYSSKNFTHHVNRILIQCVLRGVSFLYDFVMQFLLKIELEVSSSVI